MYDCGNEASVEDLLDGDTAQDEGDEGDEEDEDGNNNSTDGNSNAADGTEYRSNANNATDASTGTKSTDGTDELPPGEYFKGFLAFALWGYIPPKGGERYKSILIKTVVDKVPKVEKVDGRAAVKKEQKKEKLHIKELEKRGMNSYQAEEASRFESLKDIMVKGRKEMSKQRLYKCRINKIEFQLRFAAARIKEIKEEL